MDAEEVVPSLDDRPPPEKGTARSISLNVPALIASQLGKGVPGPATKFSAIMAMTQGRNARFSKYAGALEWRNAVVLFVNVGGKDYKNLFASDGVDGLTMTWYASPRNNESTPVVQRLLATRGEADGGGGSKGAAATPVVLFCRLEGEPYVCCGRLGYKSHVPRHQPLKFVWRLLDYQQLRGQEDFDELMAEARANGVSDKI